MPWHYECIRCATITPVDRLFIPDHLVDADEFDPPALCAACGWQLDSFDDRVLSQIENDVIDRAEEVRDRPGYRLCESLDLTGAQAHLFIRIWRNAGRTNGVVSGSDHTRDSEKLLVELKALGLINFNLLKPIGDQKLWCLVDHTGRASGPALNVFNGASDPSDHRSM